MKKVLIQEKKIRRKGTKLRELSHEEKEKIYRQYIGLVVFIAKKYIGKSPDFTFEDLIQEGILGLFKAAEKFDERKGYKFSTYAVWWIKQTITRALTEQGKTIRIPISMIEASNKYAKVRKKLLKESGREPLIEEIAAAMKITIYRVQRIMEHLENSPKIISLDMPTKQNEGDILAGFIEDKKSVSPVTLASDNILKEKLEKFFTESLTLREERIIKLRFGLENGADHTLEEIGKKIGLCRERIRRILKSALKRLKKSEVLKE